MQPSIEEIALGALPGLPKIAVHWPLIDFECGPVGGADTSIEWFFKGELGEIDPFVLVIEGSVPNEAIKKEGDIAALEPAECRSGEVLRRLLKPHECEAFGTTCTPRTPLGATMVSSEGACAAYYLYRRLELDAAVPQRKESSVV